MKVTYTNPSGRLTFEAEAADPMAAFEALAELHEVFEESRCGCCHSGNIRCDVRTADSYRFPNLKCRDCNARLDFGQHKDAGTLFAKRRDADGRPLPSGGWYHYGEGARKGQEAAPPAPPAESPSPTTTALARIALAKHAGTVRAVAEQIREDLAAGRIPEADRPTLRAAVESRIQTLTSVASRNGYQRSK